MPIKGLYRQAGNGGEAALPVGVYSITTPPRNTVTKLKGVKNVQTKQNANIT